MNADEFRFALRRLGWSSYKVAAQELRVKAGPGRIGDWATGARPVPSYIAAQVETRIELEECRKALARTEADLNSELGITEADL